MQPLDDKMFHPSSGSVFGNWKYFWQIIVGTKIIRGSGAKALEKFFVTTFSFGGDCLNAGYVQCSHLQGKKKKIRNLQELELFLS